MRLRAYEIWMCFLRELENLHDWLLRMLAAEDQAVLFEGGDVLHRIDFIAIGGSGGRILAALSR